MNRTKLLLFLVCEFLFFALASLVHIGVLFAGHDHSRAASAEGVIGAVLALRLIDSLTQPAPKPVLALLVQAFALLGTLVGTFTIAVGVGLQTRGDIAFHVFLLAVLGVGLFSAWRTWRQPQDRLVSKLDGRPRGIPQSRWPACPANGSNRE